MVMHIVIKRPRKLLNIVPATQKSFLGPLSQIKMGRVSQQLFTGIGKGMWLLVDARIDKKSIKTLGRAHASDVIPRFLTVLPDLPYALRIASSIHAEGPELKQLQNELKDKFENFILKFSHIKNDHMNVELSANLRKADLESSVLKYLTMVSEETFVDVKSQDIHITATVWSGGDVSITFPRSLFKPMLRAFNKSFSCKLTREGSCLWYVNIKKILSDWSGPRSGQLLCKVKERSRKLQITRYAF